MKKFLVIIFLALLLVGCGKDEEKKIEKFYLEDSHYGNAAITEITLEELETLENEKKNFGVFVYLPGCTSCAQFRTVLEEYTVDKNIEFYTISIKNVKGSSIDEVVEYAPSLVLYKDGNVVSYLDSLSNEHIPALTTVDGFNSWLEEYIYISK